MDNTSPQIYTEFLPISRADMEARGWEQLDFVVVGGDAYVDHPSFGTAIISRLLEAEGYKVGVLAQPRYTDCEDFKRFGKPKYGFFIGGGNVDSMVSHYSVAKIPRAEDEYSPGGKGGARPDRSATVYTKLAKQAYPDLPVILGGLEASLRRFAHYDYWLDTVLPSIAEDSGADLISFGMGEHQTVEIARRLAAGEPVESITDVNGTCYLTDFDHLPQRYVECAGFKKVASDKTAYAKACRIQMDNQDVVSGQIIVQKQSEKYLVQNIPAKPLVRGDADERIGVFGRTDKRPMFKIDFGNRVVNHLHADILRLIAHALHQFAALNRFGKTRKVLNFGRNGQLAADLRSGNQNRFEAGAGRVNAGSVSGGAGTDDEDF